MFLPLASSPEQSLNVIKLNIHIHCHTKLGKIMYYNEIPSIGCWDHSILAHCEGIFQSLHRSHQQYLRSVEPVLIKCGMCNVSRLRSGQ